MPGLRAVFMKLAVLCQCQREQLLILLNSLLMQLLSRFYMKYLKLSVKSSLIWIFLILMVFSIKNSL